MLPGFGGKAGWQAEHRGFLGQWNYDTMVAHIITHLSKSIICTTSRVNPNVNYRLWVTMIYQCRNAGSLIVTNIPEEDVFSWWIILLIYCWVCSYFISNNGSHGHQRVCNFCVYGRYQLLWLENQHYVA